MSAILWRVVCALTRKHRPGLRRYFCVYVEDDTGVTVDRFTFARLREARAFAEDYNTKIANTNGTRTTVRIRHDKYCKRCGIDL